MIVNFTTILLLFVCTVCCKGFLLFDSHGNSINTVVQTECGTIKGQWNESVQAFSFIGIPYASPPVGKLRWMPTVPLKSSNGNCWDEIFNATQYGNECLQPQGDDNTKATGDEDCLYLNVWTPTTSSNALLPVMVWIHGGNLVFANGYDAKYSPSAKLAYDTDVVYVSMNYRLNAFGFMALEMLAPVSPTNTSGNYGFMDQIEVLRWVQENIRKFGGDPNKVTLFGQSSGGTSVYALLGSPITKNLYHRAWMASASPIMNKTATQAFKDNEVFLRNTKCLDVDCLYNMSAAEIIAAIPWTEYPNWGMGDLGNLPIKGEFDGALAIVDGYVLPESPFDAWVNGNGQDVPLIISSTSHENDIGTYPDGGEWMDWTNNNHLYEHTVHRYLDTFDDVVSSMALNLYPRSLKTPTFQMASMATDARLTCATDYMSLIAATSFTSPIYRYVATFEPSQVSSSGTHYAFHGIDVLAYFGLLDQRFNQTTTREIQFGQTLRKEILSFIKTGHPATPEWKPYPMATSLVTEVNDVANGYHETECQFWLKNGFFSYAWIN